MALNVIDNYNTIAEELVQEVRDSHVRFGHNPDGGSDSNYMPIIHKHISNRVPAPYYHASGCVMSFASECHRNEWFAALIDASRTPEFQADCDGFR